MLARINCLHPCHRKKKGVMKKMKRREFLKTGVHMTIAVGTPFTFISSKDKKSVTESLKEINARVAAVKGNDLDSMTRDAIDALGGIQTIVNSGETVFIKPNFVTFPWAEQNNCFHLGECTKPEIIIAVTEECLKAGAKEVIIGDGSHLPTFDWQYAMTLDGSTDLVAEAARLGSLYDGKVTLACLETDSPGWVEVPSITPLNKIAISSLVANADKVISIPVAKTHSWAQLTLALKNFIGITPLSRYAQLIDNTWWNRGTFDHNSPQAIAQVYLDIVNSIKPDLSIIDFSIGIEGDGPTITNSGGTTLDMKDRLGSWAIIASTDIMAADATAARIMSHDVEKIKQLTMGFDMGLGEIRENSIEILGEKLDNLRVPWQPATLVNETSIKTIPFNQPTSFELLQNYPNPFNASTRIEFMIPEADFVRIKLYDASGRMIKFLVNKKMSAGKHIAHFNGSDLTSGIYFYQVTAGNFSKMKKMILLK
jgi:uncharacterized protein (DUF362 family)